MVPARLVRGGLGASLGAERDDFFALLVVAPRDISQPILELAYSTTKSDQLIFPLRSNLVVELPCAEVAIVH